MQITKPRSNNWVDDFPNGDVFLSAEILWEGERKDEPKAVSLSIVLTLNRLFHVFDLP
jgi:hypothetical protein